MPKDDELLFAMGSICLVQAARQPVRAREARALHCDQEGPGQDPPAFGMIDSSSMIEQEKAPPQIEAPRGINRRQRAAGSWGAPTPEAVFGGSGIFARPSSTAVWPRPTGRGRRLRFAPTQPRAWGAPQLARLAARG